MRGNAYADDMIFPSARPAGTWQRRCGAVRRDVVVRADGHDDGM
jgi:hypothetical protein